MKKELENRKDIELLINQFYEKVRKDKLLAPIFNDIANINWETHLPRMYDFWEGLLFGNSHYTGNPMLVHIELDKKIMLLPEHFEQWKKLFFETLDELFQGNKVEETKAKVNSIASVMLHKVKSMRN
ncbi:MAG TPA: group III truncated hemoglobin [Bacteroidia bacterium]|nr:group III truncated hemoglobin [Bacteroidia bacterium]